MAKQKTIEDIREYMEAEGYTLLSDVYVNQETKMRIKCQHGHEYEATWRKFKKGQRCPHCARKARSNDYEEVKDFIVSQGYTLVDTDYKNQLTKLNLICPNGHAIKICYKDFRNGVRCTECRRKPKEVKIEKKEHPLKYSYEYVKNYIESKGYTLISDTYCNANTKLKMRCERGHDFEMSFSKFHNGNQRCPRCNVSKGEARVAKYLDSNNIDYIREYTYVDCYGDNKPMRYDFYLPQTNTLIEYDGEGHYVASERFGGEKGLAKRKHYDQIKTNYAKDNNIKLIRIPYWNYDEIETILDKQL